VADLAGAVWKKSTRSNNSGACVEVARNLPGIVGIRDSKDPQGPVLAVVPTAWMLFVRSLDGDAIIR
jgi:hypothetical protein